MGHAGFLCLCVGACSCWVSSVLAAHCDYLALVRVLKMWRGTLISQAQPVSTISTQSLCIFAGYLLDQIRECRNLEVTANRGTPEAIQWGQIKEILCLILYNHRSKCSSCERDANVEALRQRNDAALSEGPQKKTEGAR
jgi:hypothetical protein